MALARDGWPAALPAGVREVLREACYAALRLAPWAALCAALHAGLASDARAAAPRAAARPAAALQGNAEAGRIKAESERCLECHGQAGVGQGHSAGEDGKFARLGGQQHAYIVKQVQDFRAGRRKNEFMAMMANSISDEDVADIAAYFAAQPAMASAAREGGKRVAPHGAASGAAAGAVAGAVAGALSGPVAGHASGSLPGAVPAATAQLYLHGDAARKVASCAACHGAAGEGIAGVAPVIGGQSRRYLSQQLHNWRSGERNNGPGMRDAVVALTDAEIEALALYVSEM